MSEDLPIHRESLRSFPDVQPVIIPTDSSLGQRKLSQTVLNKANDCPRSAYLYAKYEGGKGSHAMYSGSAIHRFMELKTNWCLAANEASMPYDGMGRDLMEWVLRNTADPIPIGLHDDLRWMAYHGCLGMNPSPESILGVEVMVELDLGFCTLRGMIDLAQISEDGRICTLTDYKQKFLTGTGDYSDGELSSAEKAFAQAFQNPFYAQLAAFGTVSGRPFPLAERAEVFELYERYPRHLWGSETDGYELGYLGPAIVTREELAAQRASLEALAWQTIERFGRYQGSDGSELVLAEGQWPAQDGHHCHQCPAKQECPIPEHLRGEDLGPVDDTLESITPYVKRRFHNQSQIKDDWKLIKPWVDQNGALRFGKDLILEPKTTTTRRLRSEKKLKEAIDRSANLGEPFEMADHYSSSDRIDVRQRTLTEHELVDEKEGRVERKLPPGFEELTDNREAELDQAFGSQAPF